MNNLQEIENSNGLYKIEKVKIMYYLGYGENIVYMINLDNLKSNYRKIGERRNEKF